jgi:hypothetical protein
MKLFNWLKPYKVSDFNKECKAEAARTLLLGRGYKDVTVEEKNYRWIVKYK